MNMVTYTIYMKQMVAEKLIYIALFGYDLKCSIHMDMYISSPFKCVCLITSRFANRGPLFPVPDPDENIK